MTGVVTGGKVRAACTGCPRSEGRSREYGAFFFGVSQNVLDEGYKKKLLIIKEYNYINII